MASATSSAGIWDIWDVCRAGNAEALRRLCTEGADVNLAEFSGSGSLALHFAAQAGSVACCKILLDNGSRADVANAHAWTPLLFASERGHIDVARLLLAHGVNAAHADRRGRTALHLAAEGGHEAVVRALVADAGVDPDPRMEGALTPLHLAATTGATGAVRVLVRAGAAVALKERARQETALHLACRWGHHGVARCLIDEGGAEFLLDGDGRTPLDYAVAKGFPWLIKVVPLQLVPSLQRRLSEAEDDARRSKHFEAAAEVRASSAEEGLRVAEVRSRKWELAASEAEYRALAAERRLQTAEKKLRDRTVERLCQCLNGLLLRPPPPNTLVRVDGGGAAARRGPAPVPDVAGDASCAEATAAAAVVPLAAFSGRAGAAVAGMFTHLLTKVQRERDDAGSLRAWAGLVGCSGPARGGARAAGPGAQWMGDVWLPGRDAELIVAAAHHRRDERRGLEPAGRDEADGGGGVEDASDDEEEPDRRLRILRHGKVMTLDPVPWDPNLRDGGDRGWQLLLEGVPPHRNIAAPVHAFFLDKTSHGAWQRVAHMAGVHTGGWLDAPDAGGIAATPSGRGESEGKHNENAGDSEGKQACGMGPGVAGRPSMAMLAFEAPALSLFEWAQEWASRARASVLANAPDAPGACTDDFAGADTIAGGMSPGALSAVWEREMAVVLLEVATALHFLCEHHVAHRNVRMESVSIACADGRAVLGGFGAAVRTVRDGGVGALDDVFYVRREQLLGSEGEDLVDTVAPEVTKWILQGPPANSGNGDEAAEGGVSPGPSLRELFWKSDVYGLGCLARELLAMLEESPDDESTFSGASDEVPLVPSAPLRYVVRALCAGEHEARPSPEEAVHLLQQLLFGEYACSDVGVPGARFEGLASARREALEAGPAGTGGEESKGNAVADYPYEYAYAWFRRLQCQEALRIDKPVDPEAGVRISLLQGLSQKRYARTLAMAADSSI